MVTPPLPGSDTCENTVSKKTLAINVRIYSIRKNLGDQRARIHVSEKTLAINVREYMYRKNHRAFSHVASIFPFLVKRYLEYVATHPA